LTIDVFFVIIIQTLNYNEITLTLNILIGIEIDRLGGRKNFENIESTKNLMIRKEV